MAVVLKENRKNEGEKWLEMAVRHKLMTHSASHFQIFSFLVFFSLAFQPILFFVVHETYPMSAWFVF